MEIYLIDTGTTKLITEYIDELIDYDINVLFDLTLMNRSPASDTSFAPAKRENLRYWTAINDIEFIDLIDLNLLRNKDNHWEADWKIKAINFYSTAIDIIKRKCSNGLRVAVIIPIAKGLLSLYKLFEDNDVEIKISYQGQHFSINEIFNYLGEYETLYSKEINSISDPNPHASTIIFSRLYSKNEKFEQIIKNKNINLIIGDIDEIDSYNSYYKDTEDKLYFLSHCKIIKSGGFGINHIINGKLLLDNDVKTRLNYISTIEKQLKPFLNIPNLKLGILIRDSDFQIQLQSVRLAKLLHKWGFNVLMEEDDEITHSNKEIWKFYNAPLSEVRECREAEYEAQQEMAAQEARDRGSEEDQRMWIEAGEAEMRSWPSWWESNID